MAAGPLALHPALRSWYAAGLRHVYMDDEALARLAEKRDEQRAETKAATTAQAVRADMVSAQVQRKHGGHGKQGVQGDQIGRLQARHAQREQVQNLEAATPQGPQASPVIPNIQGPQATTMPPEHWPKAWHDCLQSTLSTAKGAPVLWTYWALGEDLGGAPNAPRRDILRRILGELNLPRGTHCFWPIALPDGDAPIPQGGDTGEEPTQATGLHLEANTPIYLAGLQILAPRVCIIMGSKALRTIIPHSTTGPFQRTQYGRILFLVLPDMDMLLAENERIPRVVAYLRTALQPFMGRHYTS